MAIPIEAYFDIAQTWLQEIARNTAATRDAVEGRAAGGGTKKEKDEESRWDRFATRIERGLAGAVGQRLGQAQGLANRGFGGTVEGARYDYAMEMLARQFAAVMMPVMQAMTYGAEQIERRMRSMGGRDQNQMMGAMIGGGLGLRFGGLPGALLGATAGSAFMGGGNTTSTMAGAAGGALLGFRMGGPVGALAGAAVGAAASAPESYQNERPTDYYRRMRNSGGSYLGSVFTTYSEALSRPFSTPRAGDAPSGGILGALAASAAGAAADPRRDVTPYRFEVGEAGSAAMRIQEGVFKATGGGGENGGPLKEVVDAVLLVYDELRKLVGLAGGAPGPAPTPAGG